MGKIVIPNADGLWSDTTNWLYYNDTTQQFEAYNSIPQVDDTVYLNGKLITYDTDASIALLSTKGDDNNRWVQEGCLVLVNGSSRYLNANIECYNSANVDESAMVSGFHKNFSFTLVGQYMTINGSGGFARVTNNAYGTYFGSWNINLTDGITVNNGYFFFNTNGTQYAGFDTFVITGNIEGNLCSGGFPNITLIGNANFTKTGTSLGELNMTGNLTLANGHYNHNNVTLYGNMTTNGVDNSNNTVFAYYPVNLNFYGGNIFLGGNDFTLFGNRNQSVNFHNCHITFANNSGNLHFDEDCVLNVANVDGVNHNDFYDINKMDFPTENNVKSGVHYANNVYEGTYTPDFPQPATVLEGVTYDDGNKVGSLNIATKQFIAELIGE